MSWNRPTEKPPEPAKRFSRKARFVPALLAGVLFVGVGVWYFQDTENSGAARERHDAKIADAANGIKTAPRAKVQNERDLDQPPRIEDQERGHAAEPVATPQTNRFIRAKRSRTSLSERTFKHTADIMLGEFIMSSPGDVYIGDSESTYQNFDELFKKAVKEEIIDAEDDDEVTKELKAGVRQMREELLQRAKNGEKPSEVLIAHRDQMQKLGEYYQQIEELVNSTAKEKDLSEKDCEELIGAANKMLEEKGCKPLEFPAAFLYEQKMRMALEKENEE